MGLKERGEDATMSLPATLSAPCSALSPRSRLLVSTPPLRLCLTPPPTERSVCLNKSVSIRGWAPPLGIITIPNHPIVCRHGVH